MWRFGVNGVVLGFPVGFFREEEGCAVTHPLNDLEVFFVLNFNVGGYPNFGFELLGNRGFFGVHQVLDPGSVDHIDEHPPPYPLHHDEQDK